MNHFIGIDLGTTNSAVAYLDEIGKPHLITLDDGERLLPSAVFVDPGEKGISLINVGSSARRRAESHPERVAMHFKRIIGNKEVNPIEISGKRISATSFSALILNKLRQAAGTHLGAAPMSAIITVPATFSEAAREATRNAATKAGFDSVELINEPTAAILLASSLPNLMIDGTVLVFDLGGGTFDATLASVNGQEISVIWSEGDRHLGGINFDEKILKVIAGHGPQFTGVNIPHNNLLAEQIKKRFGVENQVDHFLYSDSSCSNRVNCTIRREEFEIAAAPLMQRVMQLVDTVLDNEKQPMEPHEVDHILDRKSVV